MRLRLFPTLAAPGEARKWVAPLAERLDEPSFYDLMTVVSELVAISVAHGASKPIDLTLTATDGSIEGTLYDEGAGTRALVRARDLQDSSLVLRVIDSLVDEWGTNPGQTRTWFRLGVRKVSRQ
jgi:anti-sigma regulatory factor (Ser/Thr protein kinase)